VALWRRSLGASLVVGLVFGAAFFVPLISWLVNVAWYVWAALAVAEMVSCSNMAAGADWSKWWPSDSSSRAALATAARHCGSSR